MDFEDIKIPNYLKETYIKGSVLSRHKKYFKKHGKIKSQLTVNQAGYLIDGYVDWKVLHDEHYKGYIKTCMIPYEQDLSNNRKARASITERMVYDKYNGRCYLCGEKVTFNDFTIDHILPLAKGGINDIENMACCCKKCNHMKGCLTMKSFINRAMKIAHNYK